VLRLLKDSAQDALCETDCVRVLKYWLKGPNVRCMLPSVLLLD
jgi:hypothetical protein